MVRFGHVNLIAHDWRRLARFYQDVFDCTPVPPARDQSGEWLEQATSVGGGSLQGMHLKLPGGGGATLEIFTWSDVVPRPQPTANTQGFGHIAFQVDDVERCLDAVERAGGSRLGQVLTKNVAGVGPLTFTYARDPEGNIVELQRWHPEDGAQ